MIKLKFQHVSKTLAKVKTSRKQERQKETVHILSDVTVPANKCLKILLYAKIPPADYI